MAYQFKREKGVAVAETTHGTVQGYIKEGLYMFKGIPYAKARRFHRPERYDWEGVFDASSYGYVCPLMSEDRPNGELLVPHRYWPQNEDCLNLNIWTPGLGDGEKRPVLVWFHGGGYFAGSSIEQVAYEGENMSQLGDAVVVSVNHRLNIIGYLDLSDYGEEYVNSGNAGTDDLIAALQWVHDNAEVFGGDPDNVTIFGQSGGGGKVTCVLQSPEADGLYHRGIIMSGVCSGRETAPVNLPDAAGSGKPCAEAMMEVLGIHTIQELEGVPYRDLANAYLKVSPILKEQGGNVGCAPFKNAYYAGDPLFNGFRKETAGIPLLIGTTYGEFSSFNAAPYDKRTASREEQIGIVKAALGEKEAEKIIPLYEAAYPERAIADVTRIDFMFRVNDIDYIAERSKLNRCTYSYLFNHDMPIDGGATPWHCSDIPYVFHNTELVPSTQEPGGVTERLEESIFASVMAFARTGNPSNDRVPEWPACTEETENVMVVDDTWSLRPDFDHELLKTMRPCMMAAFQRRAEEMLEKVQH